MRILVEQEEKMQASSSDIPRHENVELSRLRPTQLTVGMLEVKHKRKRLQDLEKRPGELVKFILETPIRVVLGPGKRAYVIDHHHLALALLKEDFESAPMEIENDFSDLSMAKFWKRMEAAQFVHPINSDGVRKAVGSLPKDLSKLEDDPYRSLAGFVRSAGGFVKTLMPFAEFQWADFFRAQFSDKALRKKFERCVEKGVRLAHSEEAAKLPGYVGKEKGGKKGD